MKRIVVLTLLAALLLGAGADCMAAEQPVLRIYGVQNRLEQHRAAGMLLDGICAEASETGYGEAALAQALLLAPDSLDVLVLQTDMFDIPRMMEKGWLMDLGQDGELAEIAQQAYPALAEAGMRDGKLYGIPVGLAARTWFADEQAFDAQGVQPPATFGQLCALVADWQQGGDEDVLPYMLMSASNYRDDLYWKAVQMYLHDQVQRQAAPLRFDTPLFRAMMAAADGVRADRVPAARRDPDGIIRRQYLLKDGMQEYSLINRTEELDSPLVQYAPLLLSAEASSQPSFSVVGALIAVNARSGQKEAALQYLKAFCVALSEQDRRMLSPQGEPVENPNAVQARQQDEQALAAARKGIENNDDNKVELAQLVIELEIRLAAGYDAGGYIISPAALHEYRTLMTKAVLQGFQANAVITNSDIFTVFKRFAAGQIDIEQFIREADNKLHLMELEGF